MPDIRTHTRVLETITGSAEKRALVWMSERMPPWVTPDQLTLLGVLGAAIVLAGYALSNLHPAWLWLSSAGLFVNWVGDSTDGTLARVRKIERPRYGFYIDHSVDVIAEAMIFLGLGLTPYVRFDLTCLAYIGYLAMSVLVYVRTCVDGVFRISYSRIGPTELRILLLGINTAMFLFGAPAFTVAGTYVGVYDAAVAAIALALAGFFLTTLLRSLRELRDVDAG